MGIYLTVSESENNLQLYLPFYSVITFPGNTVAIVTLSLTLSHAWYQTQEILVIYLRNTAKDSFAVRYTFIFTHF